MPERAKSESVLFRVSGLGFRVSGLGFRVWGLGSSVFWLLSGVLAFQVTSTIVVVIRKPRYAYAPGTVTTGSGTCPKSGKKVRRRGNLTCVPS